MDKKWFKEAIVYQIYPFSYSDYNGDGMGDIKGILSKLDYIKDLGVNAIWFSPLYDSPNYDYGYDVRDYLKISPTFGTMNDFKTLIDEIHKRGMKIIMDTVFNHTSSEHYWFKEAIKDEKSEYRKYYIFRKGIRKGNKLLPPNNWTSIFTGSAWKRVEGEDNFYLHLFDKHQPDLNWENPEVRNEIKEIFKYYCDLGVDGFRMDVFNLFSKVEGLPDDDAKFSKGRKYYIDGPKIHEYLHELYTDVFSKYDLLVVGESFNPSEENKMKYVDKNSGEINMIFDFSHLNADSRFGVNYLHKKFNLVEFKNNLVNSQMINYENGWATLVLENHDQPRSISRFGFDLDNYHYEAATMMAASTFLGFGVPFIYQGEEIGMTNTNFKSIDEYRDPVTHFVYNSFIKKLPLSYKGKLRMLNHGARDNARVPMQWDNSLYAGFSDFEPWMRLSDDLKYNVENDLKSDKSIYHFYQKLLSIKRNNKTAIYGDILDLCPLDKKVFAYKRSYKGNMLLVISNFTDKKIVYNLKEDLASYTYCTLLSNYLDVSISNGSISLNPYQTIIIEPLKEYSYGSVIYRKNGSGEIEYLLEKMGLGHTSIPKGHIEANETIEECVKREIREELSLEINLDMNFSHLITYSPSKGILKDVTFYVSTITGGDIKVDNKEVVDTVWLKYEDAINALTYESDKEVLEDANNYLTRE